MAVVFAAIGIIGLISGTFPLGYQVEVFTSNKIGAVVLFLAAATDLISIIVTQIVYRTFDKIGLISKGTIFTGMAFVALIFVFQQQILPIAPLDFGRCVIGRNPGFLLRNRESQKGRQEISHIVKNLECFAAFQVFYSAFSPKKRSTTS